jgi:RNA polymerase sporulation-specific sigma factor
MELMIKTSNSVGNINTYVINCKNGYWENFDALYQFYKPYINMLASRFYYTNGDKEDLIQQGLIGLYNAIKMFDIHKNTQFDPLAKLCIRRSILQLIRSSNAKKELIHSNSVFLFNLIEDDNILMDRIKNIDSKVPEEVLIDKEKKEEFENFVVNNFSTLEKRVLKLYMDGHALQEIADFIEVSYKTVDNAISRFKKKLKEKW